MKKPYLISLASYTPGVDRYLDTLEKLEDSVELVYVNFKPGLPIKSSEIAHTLPVTDLLLVDPMHNYPGHHHRWKYVPEDLDWSRWCIFSDTQDVMFQGPIPNLDQFGADILTQAEGMTHEENSVWRHCLTQRWPQYGNLLKLPVYCCGTFAMRGHLLHEYKTYLKDYDPAVWDQIPFNEYILDKRHADCPQLSAAIYNNFYSGALVKSLTEDGTQFWWSETGVRPAIIHGNGSSKAELP